MTGDTLIRNARIVDGTGAPWFCADLPIGDGRTAGIGPGLAVDRGTVAEADDRNLSPGLIDAHCHDDLITLREPQRLENIMQGVTTVVVGNCSFSLYPAPALLWRLLAEHFGALLGATVEEAFVDLDHYRQVLHREGAALNTVSLVGHAALGLAVMGYARPCRHAGRAASDAGPSRDAVRPRRGRAFARAGRSAKRLCQRRRTDRARRDGDLDAACTHGLHLACSDGLPRIGTRPHPRGFGTFPRFAGHLVRKGWFPLEDAVRRMTSAPAQSVNLADRGAIREGLVADLPLYDPSIEDRATFNDPAQLAEGVNHVFVAGKAVVAEGRPTGAPARPAHPRELRST